jgi:hypothetical protein
MHLEGKYIGTRITTIFDTNTNTVEEQLTKIEYTITKINETQYLVKQVDLFSGDKGELLFFVNNTGYLSSSFGGIDNIFENCEHQFVHSWSQPAIDNKLVNATTNLERICH